MYRIRYIGPFDEVVVPDAVDENGEQGATVKRKGELEVSEELGSDLIKQTGNWEKIERFAKDKRDDDEGGE